MKKFRSLGKAVFLVIVVLFTSCRKDKNEPVIVSPEKKEGFVIVDAENKGSHFKSDGLVNIRLDDRLLNNLGVGYDPVSGVEKSSIFNPSISLNPIVSLFLDESFSKKIIVSWDYANLNRLEDSILINGLGLDSSKVWHASTNGSSYSGIYGKIIVYKKFGIAKIDVNSPSINNCLTFKTNLGEGLEKDGITLAPELFKRIYGTAYRDSIVLGVFLNVNFSISDVDVKSNAYLETLSEAGRLIKMLGEGEIKWDELKANSTHFKKSSITTSGCLAIPGVFFLNSADKLATGIGLIDGFYKDAKFGILSDGYMPFSAIYPDYKFQN